MGRSVPEFNYRGKELAPEVIGRRLNNAARHDALDPIKATLKSHGINWSTFMHHVKTNLADMAGSPRSNAIAMHRDHPEAFDKFIEPLKKAK